MKKNMPLAAAVLAVTLLAGCGSTASAPAATPSPEPTATVEPAPTPTPEAVDEKEALREAFEEAIGGSGLTFYKDVRNDKTGKWRVSVIYTAEAALDHALDYYNAYFESDDEIHFVVNLGLKTTTSITRLSSPDVLQVDVHSYVDKEEHDANLLNSGDLLGSYWVYLDTGETENLLPEE